MNNVSIVGNLTRDVETRDVNGTTLAHFSVAINWRTSESEGADFIPVDVWGRQAENCAKYLKKVSKVGVTCSIKSRSWETEDGKKRSAVNVRAYNVEFLSPKGETSDVDSPVDDESASVDSSEKDLPY